MVALSFKPNWKPLIVSGRKTTTIRERARCKHGDRLTFYTGMRTKNVSKFGDAFCLRITPIFIATTFHRGKRTPEIRRDETLYTANGRERIALRDGFENAWHMIGFFEAMYGLPFSGVMIEWTLFEGVD